MRAPRAKKPDQIAEALRVLVVYDILVSGLADREGPAILDEDAAVALLAIAERIVARTEAD